MFCNFVTSNYLITQKHTVMAFINQIGNRVFLNFFNSKEVYSIKGFDTIRKAKNYANKYNYKLVDKMPNYIKEFEYLD